MVKLPENWRRWAKRGILIAGLGMIAVGLIMSLIFNVVLAPCTTQQVFIQTDPELDIFGQQFDIDCTLFQPKPEYDVYNQRPAVVLVHGFMSSKVYFRELSYELTKRGFVCLAITANGHAASGGGFTPTWENVTLSAVKYLRDKNASLTIDVNRVGLIGHSMGSFSATLASILDQELGNFWINATVGIGGPFLNITSGFGEGFAFMLKNPMVYPDVFFDSYEAISNAVIEGRTNFTCPNNYMNIIGSRDTMFGVNSAYELMYGMSNKSFWTAYGVMNQFQINTSQTYGEFNGSARRLVVLPGVGHANEGLEKTTAIETITWFEQAMKLSPPNSLDPNTITIGIGALSGLITALGGLIFIIPLMMYLGTWLKPKLALPKNAMNMEKKDKRLMILIYGMVSVGISFLAIFIISGLNLNVLIPTDFLLSNLIALPLLIQGLLMIPCVILLMWYEKRKYNLELSDFGLTKEIKPYLKAAFYGFLLFFILYILLNLAASTVLHNFYIWRIIGFLEMFLYIFVGTLVFEVMFRGMIQNKLYEVTKDSKLIPTRWKEIIKSALITGVIEGLVLGIIATGLLAAGGFNVFATSLSNMIPADMGISLDWLPPLFILIPITFILLEIMVGTLKAGLYRKINRNVMASTIFVSLTLAWLMTVLLPAITP